MSVPTVSSPTINARLDRLPVSRVLWRLVVLLSLGACFEFYDLFMTAYLPPGLFRAGLFHADARGLFGLSDQASFAAVTFLGLFLGTIAVAGLADRLGRRAVFTLSLLWYTVATVAMALSWDKTGVLLWRFVAGIGIGVELVTVDTYITELVPAVMRGRAIAVSQAVQFVAIPVVAFLCYVFVPIDPLGIEGWRIVVLLGAIGAISVWFIRAGVPESPRWLVRKGRLSEADAIVGRWEKAIEIETMRKLPPASRIPDRPAVQGSFAELFRPPYLGRTVLMSVFNIFQTIGFYGFGNWVVSLVAQQGAASGVSVTHGQFYAFLIAIAYPIGPFLFTAIADTVERKWQICAAALGTASFGLLFSQAGAAWQFVTLGVLITLSNNLLSYSYHAYQAELFPTRIRALAVGFVYSWSRISTVFTSFAVAFFLRDFGTVGVFAFIAASMGVVIVAIAVFGPRTGGLSLEELSG